MANNFVALSVVGGSLNSWGTTLNTLIQAGGIGALTAELYNDSGTLKLSKGKIGINNSIATGIGVCIIDTITTISTAGMTAGLWHAIEVSVSGTAVTIEITPIAGASDESVIDAATKAAYDYEKTGYYLTASKRLIGVVFLRTALALGRIVNCESGKLGFKNIKMIQYYNGASVTTIYKDKLQVNIGSWDMDTIPSISTALPYLISSYNKEMGAVIHGTEAGTVYDTSLNSYGGMTRYKVVTGVAYLFTQRETGGYFDNANWNAVTLIGWIEYET